MIAFTILQVLDKNLLKEQHRVAFYTFLYISVMTESIGMQSLVWFVSFKYWETARQFSRMIRFLALQNNLNEVAEDVSQATPFSSTFSADESDNVKLMQAKLKIKHKKYNCYRWTGFAVICVTGVSKAIFDVLNDMERADNKQDFEDDFYSFCLLVVDIV